MNKSEIVFLWIVASTIGNVASGGSLTSNFLLSKSVVNATIKNIFIRHSLFPRHAQPSLLPVKEVVSVLSLHKPSQSSNSAKLGLPRKLLVARPQHRNLAYHSTGGVRAVDGEACPHSMVAPQNYDKICCTFGTDLLKTQDQPMIYSDTHDHETWHASHSYSNKAETIPKT